MNKVQRKKLMKNIMEELHAPGLSHLKSEKVLFFHNKIIKKQIHSVVSLFYMYDSNEPKTPQLNSYEKMIQITNVVT
jgi:hypothetical protein